VCLILSRVVRGVLLLAGRLLLSCLAFVSVGDFFRSSVLPSWELSFLPFFGPPWVVIISFWKGILQHSWMGVACFIPIYFRVAFWLWMRAQASAVEQGNSFTLIVPSTP
jgi:hypothetical protein